MLQRSSLGVAAILVFLSCMGCDDGSGSDDSSSENGGAAEFPCTLLTADEVSVVVPGHDGGAVSHSGPSLIEGIEAHQCAWMNDQYELLSVVLNVASTQELLGEVEPIWSVYEERDDAHRVDVGDNAAVVVASEGLTLIAVAGLTRVDVELLRPDASTREEDVVALAEAVIQRLP